MRFSLLSTLLLALVSVVPLWSAIPPAMAQTAQATGPSTGLPLPRFASIRNAPTNVRVGPGTRYDIAFVFLKPGVPVEIVQEFDTWRKIRDADGAEGWLHQNLIVGTRTAIVTPWRSDGQVALLSGASPDATPRAWLTPNLIVGVRRCDSSLCEVRFSHADADGRSVNYAGFVDQQALWGVYANEVFD